MLDGDHKALVDAALSVCARYGLAVAGGYAVKAHGLVERPSEDIDFATSAAAPIKEPLNHPVVWMDFGPVIALADTVALKMGALHDRALPRDVLDAHGAAARFTRAELIAVPGGAR